jgi:hypothetical protein
MLARVLSYVALCAAFLLAGCAAIATGPPYESPSAPPAGYANVVIYRVPSPFGEDNKFDWFIDDHLAVRLNNQGYSRVLVRAGQHYIHNTLPATGAGLKIAPLVLAGRTYYFRDTHVVRDNRYFRRFEGVAQVEAEKELQTYRFQAPISESID